MTFFSCCTQINNLNDNPNVCKSDTLRIVCLSLGSLLHTLPRCVFTLNHLDRTVHIDNAVITQAVTVNILDIALLGNP